FPILMGLGISTTLGFREPCGMNTPHVHPRAAEFLTLVEEENLKFAGENAEISGTLEKYEGTAFPIGSIHYQTNDNCDRVVSIASLNSKDPETSQVAQNFFGLNPDVVNPTLGFPKQIEGNIAQFRKAIPPNLARGIDSCLQGCNIDILDFPLP
ncbi:hypothetical protein CC78DRAFT_455084, partial [Lojkania enalia]